MRRRSSDNLVSRWTGLGLMLLGVLAPAPALAEPCMSPYVKRLAGPEKYLYVSAVDADAKDNDFLAVIDVHLASPTYGRALATVDLGSAGNEPHHMGFTDDRTKIWLGALLSKRLFILDVAGSPARPTIIKTIEDITAVTGLHGPHTYYALPGRMLLTFLSSADGSPPGGLAEFTNDGEFIRAWPNPAAAPYMYDVAVKPDINRMITSSFTALRNYAKPLAQWDMKDGGNTLLVWDFKERRILQTLVTDPVPLEVRWSLAPGKAHGWTNSALGDSIWFFRQGQDGRYAAKKAASLGQGCLPADLRQSPDDRYLYVSCFMRSEIQAWDASTPDKPRLHDTVVPGVAPNMMHVTMDGRRMYVTNSLLSTMDYSPNFWIRLVHIGPDGRLKTDPFFDVDFTKFPTGAARAHDMLLY
jgi:selenium-binding protein 1